jgi:pumilio homology domain family member 6
VDALLADIRGRVMDVTLRHDASRIVQSILQFGSLEQRLVVVTELCKKAVDVSKAPYGHFAILKALTYCKSAEEQAMIVKALAGHYLSLGCNAIGARVVESMYASELLTTAQKCTLNAEFYGRKYTVFLPAGVLPVSLAAVVAHTPESKYFSVLEHMQEIIQRFVNKSLFEFSYVHQFVFEYLSEIMRLDATFQHNQGGAEQAVAGAAVREGSIHTRGKFDKDKIQAEFTKRMADAIALLLDHLQRLMSTKAGCKAVLICVTYMSVKERKTFVKSLKSHVVASLTHSSAHLVIMKLVDCVDDSVLVHKSLLDELLEGAGPAAKGQGGCASERLLRVSVWL